MSSGAIKFQRAVSAPDADPNVTEPPEADTFAIPPPSSYAPGVWFGSDGTPTIEVWARINPNAPDGERWALIYWAISASSAVPIPSANTIVSYGSGFPPPCAVPLFLRVTAVGGATRIFAGSLW